MSVIFCHCTRHTSRKRYWHTGNIKMENNGFKKFVLKLAHVIISIT